MQRALVGSRNRMTTWKHKDRQKTDTRAASVYLWNSSAIIIIVIMMVMVMVMMMMVVIDFGDDDGD